MAPPKGESGARLDTAAGRAAEAAFQQRKAAAAAEAAMRVAQAEAEQGRAAEAARAVAAAAAAAQNAAPAVQQAVATHAQQIQTGGSGAAPVPQVQVPTPAAKPAPAREPGRGSNFTTPVPTPTTTPAPVGENEAYSPVGTKPEGREVTLDYAREIERRVNELLAQGNIEGARKQAENITGGGAGVQNALGRMNTAIEAAFNARSKVVDSQRTPTGDADPDGDGSGPAVTPAKTAEDIYYEGLEQDRLGAKKSDREAASSFLRGILSQYNLGSLAGSVESLINDWGNNVQVIAEKLRQTEPYKIRFKGLTSLQQRGIPDVTNEAEYLELETNYRQVFREAGLSSFLGQSGTQTEYDAIAKIAGDFSLSVNEVRDRITDAQRIVAQTPQEVRDSFQRFYNVDPATLTAYVLDPTRTASEINRKANAAMIGGLGMQRGLEFGAGVSERIGSFLGGEGDLTGTQAEPILGEIADVQRATGRLAQLEKSTLSAEETALAQLDLDTGAKEKVKGLQSRERARFGGTGAFSSTALGGVNKI